ncbi:MAG: SDR family NAD(P)-dependent oxidoreductase [Paracoccaceae bacterium]
MSARRDPGPRLDGRVALVSGAGSIARDDAIPSIGSAVAKLLADAGAMVFVLDRDPVAAAHTADWIIQDGGQARPLVCDIAQEGAVETAVAELMASAGRLDILVNNAAVTSTVSAVDMSHAEWSRVVDVNLRGAMFLSAAALRVMSPQHSGAIINILSPAGMRSFANPAYAAAKAGLGGLTVDLAGAWGGHGIRVNAVTPGTVWTPMVQRLDPSPGARKLRGAVTALGTEGTGWDVAFAVLFLASDEARWVTGNNIVVDGGFLTLPPSGPRHGADPTAIDPKTGALT